MKMLIAVFFNWDAVSLRVDGQTNSVLPAGTSGQTLETIVCIRHGEKPHGGLGQLTCRGLNRALALPKVLLGKYGSPQFLFAPIPPKKWMEQAGRLILLCSSSRNHRTTAIRCGLPVNTQFGFREINGLESELQKQDYRNATVLSPGNTACSTNL